MNGIVKWYNIRHGYGMIKGEDGNEVFVHKTVVPFWTIFLKSGDKVEYIPQKSSKGLVATKLVII